MPLAGMGEQFLRRHTWAGQPWYEGRVQGELERFKNAGVDLRDYDPLMDQPDTSPKTDHTERSEGDNVVGEELLEG
jgi:hypothetical protein